MFGIGAGEMVVILMVVLIAVGPDRMPSLMKAVGRGAREFRKTTREIRSTVGIDELMRDDDFRDPLGLRKGVGGKTAAAAAAKKAARPPARAPLGQEESLTEEERQAEQPIEGVDLAFMREVASRPASADEVKS